MTELILKVRSFKSVRKRMEFKDFEGRWWMKDTNSDCNFKHNATAAEPPWDRCKWFEDDVDVLAIVGSV